MPDLHRGGRTVTVWINPCLRWVGGKMHLLSTLLPIIEGALASRDQPVYVEPFLGAGAVALNLEPSVAKILCDLCDPLMVTWREVRYRPAQVAARLATMGRGAEADYYRVRARFNERLKTLSDDTDAIAAEFLYLNRISFNGIWRVNAQGLYNVPWGRKEKDMIGEDHLTAIAARIPIATGRADHRQPMPIAGGTLLMQGEAVALLGGYLDSPRPLVVYADPPYDGTYDSYGVGGFGADDQRNLAEVLHALAERGHAIITTNADTLLVRELYSWAIVGAISEQRQVSSNGNRDRAACLLITRNC